MQSAPITTDVVSSNLDQGEVMYNIMWYSLSVTCDRFVVFSGSFGFLHQYNWLPRYNWNIVESGVKHYQTNNNKLTIRIVYITRDINKIAYNSFYVAYVKNVDNRDNQN